MSLCTFSVCEHRKFFLNGETISSSIAHLPSINGSDGRAPKLRLCLLPAGGLLARMHQVLVHTNELCAPPLVLSSHGPIKFVGCDL